MTRRKEWTFLVGLILVIALGRLVGCGDDAEHVPNPFARDDQDPATEKVYVAGSGSSPENPDAIVGRVIAITHGGADDLTIAATIETAALTGELAVANGHLYVSNPEENTVTAINAGTDEIEGVIRVGARPVTVDVRPTGDVVFSVNTGTSADAQGGSVSAIDALPAATTFLLEVARGDAGAGAHAIAFSSKRPRVFIGNRDDGTVTVFDANPELFGNFIQPIGAVAVGASPGIMTYSPVSGSLYVTLNAASADESVAIVGADAAEIPRKLSGIRRGSAPDEIFQPTFIRASVDAAFVWVPFFDAQSNSGGLGAIDVRTNRIATRLTLDGFVPGQLVEAEGRQLYLSGGKGTNQIVVIDASVPSVLREVTRVLVGNAGVGRSLALSHDGTRLYVTNPGDNPAGVSVIDIVTHQVIATIPTPETTPTGITVVDLADVELPMEEEDEFGGHGHDPSHHGEE